jgi:hypothetical protein
VVCWSDGNYGLPDIRHRVISSTTCGEQVNELPVFSLNQ